MNERELYRAIAHRTGESVQTIKHLGFSAADSSYDRSDLDASDGEPQMVDWDRLEFERLLFATSA
jgi:hypothetical protein